MRLTAIILLAGCLHVAARVNSQTITYSAKNAELQSLFKVIKKQTGFTVVAKKDFLKQTEPVSVDVVNMPLEDFLRNIFKDQSLEFNIEEQTIVLSKKNISPTVSEKLVREQPPVTGVVKDSAGSPLVAATITNKRTKKSVQTGAKGEFTIEANEGDELVVSFIGFKNSNITITGNNVIAVLFPSTSPLDEVQIIAYGKTSRRYNTGNTTTIKGSEIENQPVSNVLQSLIGRVPGLQITPENNIPGGGITVRVQGQNSISNGNDPLYIVDGVPYVSQMLRTTANDILGGSGAPGAGSGNPLSYLNPNDIESIDVLKDADATAIYGSRAANGAILITTKKGKAGKTDINFTLQKGWAKSGRFLSLMDKEDYFEMRYEALKNDGKTTPSSSEYDINGTWDTSRYTDWQKKLAGGTAQYENISGTVSGGSANTRFMIGTSYRRETTIFSNDFSNKKAGVHFNIDHSSLNQRFNIQLTGNYLSNINLLPSFNPGYLSLNLAPNAPSLYEEDGKTLNWAPDQLGRSSWTNPLVSFLTQYHNTTKNLLSNAIISYELLRGLTLKTSVGYNTLETDEFIGTPLTAIKPEDRPFTTAVATYSNSIISSWIAEPQVTYNKTIGKSIFNVLGGSTFQQRNSDGRNLTALGFSSDNALEDITAATSITANSSVASVYKYNALFGRVNYNFNNRYLVNFNIRKDGSSRFGSANKFHTFSSIGAAWIFSNEKFFRNHISFISFAKLRGSYGTTGNDQITDYLYYNLFTPRNYGVPYQNGAILVEDRLTNPYLQWEETRKLQFGIDIGILKDRILITANYARNRSSNQLLEYLLPAITGYTSVQTNFPATVQNTSFELSLNATVLKRKNIDWTITGNITIPKNKLVDFPNLATSSYADFLIVGQPLNVIKAYHFMGVDSETGKYQFEGSDGKPTINPEETDRRIFLNTSPKFYGGLGNAINFHQFQLNVFFQFSNQRKPGFLFGNLNSFYPPGRQNVNQPVQLHDRWKEQGDIATVQKASNNFSLFGSYGNLKSSDAYFENASFIRLQNLTLSYQLPINQNAKSSLRNMKTFIEAQNLFTITSYSGLDPESPTSPRLRYVTIGVSIGL